MSYQDADRLDLRLFVGRADLLRDLQEKAVRGRSWLLTAGRRTGKTMVLRKLAERLKETAVVSIYVDALSLSGSDRANNLVENLLAQTAEATGSSMASTLEEQLDAASAQGRGWCLLLDHVEAVANARGGDVVMDNLRYLVSSSRHAGAASVGLAGGPDMLMRLRSSGSSLSNVCSSVALPLLDRGDVTEMACAQLGSAEGEGIADTVWDEAGGHPWLSQALLQRSATSAPIEAATMPDPARVEIVSRFVNQVRALEPLVLDAAGKVMEGLPYEPHLEQGLVNSGLVRRDGERLAVAGRIQREALAALQHEAAAGVRVRAQTPADQGAWVRDLAAAGERPTVEFKESVRWDTRRAVVNEDLKDEIPKEIAGFMNAEGGVLLVGVANDGSIQGLASDAESIRRNPTIDGVLLLVADLLRSSLGGGLAGVVSMAVVDVDGRSILALSTGPAPRPVFVKRGDRSVFFTRIGTSTPELDARETVEYVLAHWPALDRL